MCVKILRNCHIRSHHSNITMPFYAVAVGRNVGIYDSYVGCKEQVLNYPNSKFKKFDTVEEARAFIEKIDKPSTFNSNTSTNLRVENETRPPLFKPKQKTLRENTFQAVYNAIESLEDKFNTFVTNTNTILENLNNRLLKFESSGSIESSGEPPKSSKRIRLDEPDCYNTDQTTFLKNPNDVVIVYTDGACINNGRKGAKAGVGVWFNHGHPSNVSAPLHGGVPATNNNAEIQAARVAINQAANAGIKKLCIHTDSQFLIKCITEWIRKWKTNNWKSVNGLDVKNKVELVKLDSVLGKMELVEWKYVEGHKGVEGNEMADKLARNGAAFYRTNAGDSSSSDS